MTLATAYMLPYLPGDCLKIVVSVILAPRILKAMERNS
jgi:biotin transport system substrate-specific component